MKRFAMILALVLVLVVALTGCKCEHEWTPADCHTPKTCNLCQLTEGEPLAHVFADATCVTPQTCTLCGDTQGELAPHPWEEANCQNPKTCQFCGTTEGGLGDHIWLDATTDAPKTCSLCAVTEGEKIETDPRFTTAATRDIQGIWACEHTFTGEDLGMAEFLEEVPVTLLIKLEPNGGFKTSVQVNDDGAYMDVIRKVTVDFVYETYETMGMDKAATDTEIMETYGKTVEEYAEELSQRSARLRFEAFLQDGVYYVEDGQFYLGKGWNSEFASGGFRVDEDGYLSMDVLAFGEGGAVLSWFAVQ